MAMQGATPPVFVALDFATATQANRLVAELGPEATHYKVGLQLYLAAGRPFVESLIKDGKQVFLDLKFHDIPNTVEQAVVEAAKLGVSLCTVHALAGSVALRRSTEAARRVHAQQGDTQGGHGLGILAVTMLTSVDQQTASEMGLTPGSLTEHVLRLARLAAATDAHGVVCAAAELVELKRACPGLRALVPGIRPHATSVDDQARVATPRTAARLGADYLVVGRPITQASDPRAAFLAICAELL